MRALKLVMASIFFASAATTQAASLSSAANPLTMSVAQGREQLALHNRCVAAATYAMLDDTFPETESKAEYFRHRDAGEAIIRHVSPGKRAAFMAKVPTIREYQSVFQNLQWGKAMKALIKQEFEGCKTI